MASPESLVRDALRSFFARTPDLGVPGGCLVVAFSGGQDSTCLLHATHELFPALELVAAHVDHGLRATSAADAQRVLELATAIGVAAHLVHIDVARYRGRRSLQDAARAARYHALATTAQHFAANAVLVAHTADDQAETVLLNLVRGASLRGLTGMRADEVLDPNNLGPAPAELPDVSPTVRVARPLLRIDRTTTLAYCARFGLPVVEDTSNQSRAFTRNRVRHDLLPLLERFNPAIRGVLCRTADLVGDDLAALDAVTDSLHATLARPSSGDALAYDLRAWRLQPRALQRRLLRQGLHCLLGTLQDVPAQPIDDAVELLRSAHRGQTYHLPYGVELVIATDEFELRRFGAAKRPNNQGRNPSRV